MSKITLNNVGSIPQNPTSAQSTINSNNLTIEASFDNTLSLDGTAPNEMGSTFDMNSNQIINLPQPATANSPLRLQDLDTFTGGGTITNIPAGGKTGDRLVKTSNTDYQVGWGTEAADLAAGANITITGSSPATIATTQNPNFTTSVTTPSFTLNGTTVTGITGTGNLAGSTSPTLVTPALGTPSAAVLTNATGTAAGLTAGNVTTNANLTGDVTSVGNATTLPNASVITKVLTGYTSGAGTVASTDSILQAIQKLNGNDATNANLTGAITSVGNATSIASQTGTGTKFVVDTTPTLITPLLGTPTSGVLTNCTGLPVAALVGTLLAAQEPAHTGDMTNSAGSLVTTVSTVTGTTTNDNAASGKVGELLSADVASGSAVSLTTGTAKDVTTLSLTAGDWDVWISGYFTGGASTTVTTLIMSISGTLNTLDQTNGKWSDISGNSGVLFGTATGIVSENVPQFRLSLSGTTTIHMVARADFGVSTCSAYGTIFARRRR